MTTSVLDKQIPLFARNLELALRSGYNLKQALEIIAQDMPSPANTEAQWAVDELNRGVNLPQLLNDWTIRTPNRDLDLILAAIRVQLDVEGNLADKLQLLSQIMEKRTLTVND